LNFYETIGDIDAEGVGGVSRGKYSKFYFCEEATNKAEEVEAE
jgi:hypothetical protein